jgi:hypothetical protein
MVIFATEGLWKMNRSRRLISGDTVGRKNEAELPLQELLMKKGKFMNEVTKERRLAKANMIFS